MDKPCKDCHAELVAGTIDKIPARKMAMKKGGIELAPGPRCVTHHRAFTKTGKARSRERYVAATYNLKPGQYPALYAAQGGKCAICARATGATKNLAVDHDHSCCDGPISCGKCVRGLLCSVCNVFVGRMRDDPEAFMRGYKYLKRPPAQAVLLSLDSEG